MWRTKIKNRIKLLYEACINIIYNKERGHPYSLILWKFMPSYFWHKNLPRLGKKLISANIDEYDGDSGYKKVIFDLGIMKISGHDQPEFLYVIAHQYINLIYPYIVQNPIYALIDEGPYENGKVVLSENDVVIDAGANLGVWTIFASSRVGPDGKIYAFEPASHIRKYLEQNVELNLAKNVNIVPLALGETTGSLTLYFRSIEDATGVLERATGKLKKEIVIQTTLDRFILDNKIKKVDFIKMDIEGMERNALKGARAVIDTFKPKLSICTYHLKDDPIILIDIIRSIDPRYKYQIQNNILYAWYDE